VNTAWGGSVVVALLVAACASGSGVSASGEVTADAGPRRPPPVALGRSLVADDGLVAAVDADVPLVPPDAGGVRCGDDLCQAAENCATCEADCGSCPEPRPDASVACAHTECQAGTPLAASCGECVAAICATDDFCCDIAWDNLCIGALGAVCGKSCP
jgi:hypothetical protein